VRLECNFFEGRPTPTGARVAAGEVRTAYIPARWKYDGSRPVVVWGHGHGQLHYAVPPGFGAALLTAWVHAGWAVVIPRAAGDSWGNDNAIESYGDALAYAEAPQSAGGLGARVGAHLLYGYSMGALACCNFARANPSKVAAILLSAPGIERQRLYDVNINGYGTAEIAAAYGGAGNVPTTRATHDPSFYAADLADIPIDLTYDPADPVTSVAGMEAFAAASGATLRTGAFGHHPELPPLRVSLDLYLEYA
jgi:pimeloyl-ACP methyl ester carboxylesterase